MVKPLSVFSGLAQLMLELPIQLLDGGLSKKSASLNFELSFFPLHVAAHLFKLLLK